MADPIEQRLSYLGFRLIPPPPPLQPYVTSFWAMRSDSTLSDAHEEYMHPGGGFGIMFNLGDPFTLNGQFPPDALFLDGTNSISYRARFTGNVNALGVRFHPGAAYAFLRIPLHELADSMLSLDIVDQQTRAILGEQLSEAASLEDQVEAVSRWLLARLSDPPVQPIIPASLKLIRSYEGLVSMPQLADSLNISQRQLERLYQTHVGITPKHYARLLRVSHAREALKATQDASLAALAASLGYYDQPHFIHEFKAVVGMTPQRYLLRSRSTGSDRTLPK